MYAGCSNLVWCKVRMKYKNLHGSLYRLIGIIDWASLHNQWLNHSTYMVEYISTYVCLVDRVSHVYICHPSQSQLYNAVHTAAHRNFKWMEI